LTLLNSHKSIIKLRHGFDDAAKITMVTKTLSQYITTGNINFLMSVLKEVEGSKKEIHALTLINLTTEDKKLHQQKFAEKYN
jgi:hypothetical protein